MFMAAGFCMLEGGLQEVKYSCYMSKNIGLFSIAGFMYYLVELQFNV